MNALSLVQYPWLLALVLVLPVLAIVLLAMANRKRRQRIQRLGTPNMVARLAPAVVSRRPWLRPLILALAAACAALAFAGPRWGSEAAVVRGSGIDMVLCLDASLSMLAPDERPSRLERLKQEVRRLRSLSEGDRVALIAFAGRSYILTPLTIDDGALDLFLDNLDPSVVGQGGSSLARTIRQATDLLLSSKAESDRAIVVMSDGEAFEPVTDVQEAAKRAADNGISLVTVGFGTQQGSTIPVRTDSGTGQKRDENGQVVVTHYTPEMLQAAAQAANGTFVDAAVTDKAARIRQALSSLRTKARAIQSGQDLKPRFQLFLVPALLLLLLDTILVERRGRRPRTAAASATAAALLVFLVGGCRPGTDLSEAVRLYDAHQPARAADLFRQAVAGGDKSANTLYGLGTSLVAADSNAAAVDPLDHAGSAPGANPELRYRALFNLGLAHLKQGLALKGDSATPELDATLAAYKKVLLAKPNDMDAKWNYELALRKKKSGGGGGGGGGGGASQAPAPSDNSKQQSQAPKPSGGLGTQRAEQLLNSAAREERDVQGEKQKRNRAEPPPGGKDW